MDTNRWSVAEVPGAQCGAGFYKESKYLVIALCSSESKMMLSGPYRYRSTCSSLPPKIGRSQARLGLVYLPQEMNNF